MNSQRRALDIPRANIVLGFCKVCGFISNIAFNQLKVDYVKLIPEEQVFSQTFNDYAIKQANHLIDSYNLYNKNILEIGCGRGDFLALLCEIGENYGVGIDPSESSGMIQSKILDRLTFIKNFFCESHKKYVEDFICCRHTLEHISDTAQFIKTVRKAIGYKTTPVFFEVPDTTRILDEVAFWDIYYEHCSYFNLNSLAKLFRKYNFEETYLGKVYADQYLVIEAKPVDKQANKEHHWSESIDVIAKLVDDFSIKYLEKLTYWKCKLEQIKSEKRRVVVWGSGSKCVGFMNTLQVEDQIDYVVDINPLRHGKFISGVGKQIVSPEFLRVYKPDTIIVMNPVYCNEIKCQVESMGIKAEYLQCL
jgi:SAM-dependent methyltransferase